MDFAVVKISGKQHLVKQGDVVSVQANLGKPDAVLEFGEVFLQSLNGGLTVGTPLVPHAKVSARIVSSGKGKKIDIIKFKAKSRYRRAMGFRPQLTRIEILPLTRDHPAVKKEKATVSKTSKTAGKRQP